MILSKQLKYAWYRMSRVGINKVITKYVGADDEISRLINILCYNFVCEW
jgi:hypothetical protein